ncbi:hypothetical protein [Leifsonia poae]|uniref:hypothetical protein n=1 Tax=Leifsonia poae TaxID=110933 RepID=UPI001CBC4D38|nr:hypothetical protein [Leifsonia poae]
MRPFGRALTLALLSAVTAEFLLGDHRLAGAAPIGEQLAALVLYGAFSGAAAVLIRDVARRTGRGWPTILLLAVAFGVIEQGMLGSGIGELGAIGTIGALGRHVIWGVSAPIAVVEALFPGPVAGRIPVAPQRQAPWLAMPGTVIAGAAALLGGAALLVVSVSEPGFAAAPRQWALAVAAAVIAAAAVAVVVALRLPRRSPLGRGHYWWSILVALVATSAFIGVDQLPRTLPLWLSALFLLLPLAAGAVLVVVLRLDVLGLASGAILTACWHGLTDALPLGVLPGIEQNLLVGMSIAVLYTAYLVQRRRPGLLRAQSAVL